MKSNERRFLIQKLLFVSLLLVLVLAVFCSCYSKRPFPGLWPFDSVKTSESEIEANSEIESESTCQSEVENSSSCESDAESDFIYESEVESDSIYESEIESESKEESTFESEELILFKVTFLVDGTLYFSDEVENGQNLNEPDAPHKNGYEFLGWYVGEEEYDFLLPVTKDVVLVAKWQKESVYYNVTFVIGTSTTTHKVQENSCAFKPSDPQKEGCEFLGWYVGEEKYDFSSPVTKDMFLVAKWQEEIVYYNVTFVIDTSTTTQRVQENGYAFEPSDPQKEGYEFLGWYVGEEEYDFLLPVTKDVVLVAKWQKEIVYYSVTFVIETSITTQKVQENSCAVKPNDPQKEGHEFLGWYLDDQKYNFLSPVTKDIFLVAKWQEEIVYYNVTFVIETSITTQKVQENSCAVKPNDPQKEGHEFLGWYVGEEKYDFSSPVTKDIILVAKWQKEIVYYTVSFVTNNDAVIDSKTVAENSLITKPEDPVNQGYIFLGWLLDGQEFNFNTPITRDIELVANWVREDYSYSIAGTWVYEGELSNLQITIVIESNGMGTFQYTDNDYSVTYNVTRTFCNGKTGEINYEYNGISLKIVFNLIDGNIVFDDEYFGEYIVLIKVE